MEGGGPREWRCDVLVVGGGRAGACVANQAVRRGASVTLLAQQHVGWLHPAVELVHGFVWGVFAPDDVGAVVGGTAVAFRPRRLVLALPPFAVPEPIPGWGLPGVVGIDELDRVEGTVVLAGAGAGLKTAARRLAARGCRVVAVVADGLVRCDGHERFEALVLADGRRIRGDWCVLHGGWVPESGLARAIGVPCRVVAPGVLAPEAGPEVATAVATSSSWRRVRGAGRSHTQRHLRLKIWCAVARESVRARCGKPLRMVRPPSLR